MLSLDFDKAVSLEILGDVVMFSIVESNELEENTTLFSVEKCYTFLNI